MKECDIFRAGGGQNILWPLHIFRGSGPITPRIYAPGPTRQRWHELLFIIHIPFCCTWLWTLDARQLGRHVVHTLLHLHQQLMSVPLLWRTSRHVVTAALHLHQQLLSRSTCSLEGLKYVLLVVPETLTRCFINSWLTVDDHEIEAFAKQQAQNANGDRGRLLRYLLPVVYLNF